MFPAQNLNEASLVQKIHERCNKQATELHAAMSEAKNRQKRTGQLRTRRPLQTQGGEMPNEGSIRFMYARAGLSTLDQEGSSYRQQCRE